MSEIKPETLPSSTLLAKGEIVAVGLNSGATVDVKVRLLPARHLNAFLDLRDIGKEAALLEMVLQRNLAPAGEPARFEVIDPKDAKQVAAKAEFVDDLNDFAVAQLIEIADKLNFARAVSQAERQIAMGTALLPLKKKVAETMMQPVEQVLQSLTSSLISQLSAAAASKKP